MTNFIKLTKVTYSDEEGDPIQLRKDCIEAFWPLVDPRHGNLTHIQVTSGISVWVKETPEEIVAVLGDRELLT